MNYLKKYILFLIITFGVLNVAFAQKTEASLLPEPKDWRLEKINFPLDFAPDIDLKGFEELRFALGMFDRTSDNYFSYVFAIRITDDVSLTAKELKPFLLKYYRGLCAAVAKSKKMTVDVSKIDVILKLITLTKDHATYEVELVYFDTFNNGEEIRLHIEIESKKDIKTKISYLLALASPAPKEAVIWKKLYEIKKTATLQ